MQVKLILGEANLCFFIGSQSIGTSCFWVLHFQVLNFFNPEELVSSRMPFYNDVSAPSFEVFSSDIRTKTLLITVSYI